MLLPVTRYAARSAAAASAGLKVGDQVAVYGRQQTKVATRIVFDTAPFLLPGVNRLTGTVASTSDNTLMVMLTNGSTVTVQLTATTRYRMQGRLLPQPPTLIDGTRVNITGRQMTDSPNLQATLIAIPVV